MPLYCSCGVIQVSTSPDIQIKVIGVIYTMFTPF